MSSEAAGRAAFNPSVFVKVARPKQWVKNLFVLAAPVFGHSAAVDGALANTLLAFLAFCLASSAVYCANDVVDAPADRLHPDKRRRPVASGELSPLAASTLSALLAAISLALAFSVSLGVLFLCSCYLSINAAYVAKTKNIPILDVFSISAGFMTRLLAGALAAGVPPSPWLLLCGLFITLFLGFAKRRSETARSLSGTRSSLEGYPPGALDGLLLVCAACSVISYGTYAVLSSSGHDLIGKACMMTSVAVAAYAIMRASVSSMAGKAEDAASSVVSDPHLLVPALLWTGLVGAFLLR